MTGCKNEQEEKETHWLRREINALKLENQKLRAQLDTEELKTKRGLQQQIDATDCAEFGAAGYSEGEAVDRGIVELGK